MTLDVLVQKVLTEPSPELLWRLNPYLLALSTPEADAARSVARKFYAYLTNVRSKLSSKQYSTLAAMLAAGSVGALSVKEWLCTFQSDREHMLRHMLVGGLAETLEVLAAFQHIKAWEMEFTFMHEEVVWTLYEQWWQLSTDFQPELDFEQRHALVDSLLTPVRDESVNSTVRVAMAFRLFQMLLIVRLAPLLGTLDLISEGGK